MGTAGSKLADECGSKLPHSKPLFRVSRFKFRGSNFNTKEETMPVSIDSEREDDAPQDSAGNGAGATSLVSARKAKANRANAQNSTGPRTEVGLGRVARNLPASLPPARLLGLAEARTLKLEPGAAEQLYRELIAPFQPVSPLLAMHFHDLARLQLELQALERIRDAVLEHRAQQNALKVRRLYLEMDRELGVSPKDVFEKGLCNIEDSVAKLRMQVDALTVLKTQLQRQDFQAIGPALRQLYSDRLKPHHERGELICIDCRRLMDPQGEPFSDEDLKLLLRLVDREIEDAMETCRLALDEKTKTFEARVAELAPTREEHWLNVQIDRLRRAVDRNKRLLPKLLEALNRAQAKPTNAPGGDENGAPAEEKKIP
jgi:hypothetical protein